MTLCIGIMFYLNWMGAIIACFILLIIFSYLLYRVLPPQLWGEVTQALLFHQVRKYLLRLDERRNHSKLWRPSVLLLIDDVDLRLMDFCNQLKKGGLYVIGIPLIGSFNELGSISSNYRNDWLEFIQRAQLKAFPTLAVGTDVRTVFHNIVSTCGLGGLRVNIVVLPLNVLRHPIPNVNEQQ
eukprot:UN33374